MPLAIFWATLVEGILAFVATHIDDFFLLVLLFAQAQLQPLWKGWHIWLGGYLGLAGLILLSSLGYLGGLLLPPPAIGLLGVIPIAVGGWKLWQPEPEETLEKELEELRERLTQKAWPILLPSPVLMSMLFTFANGGDNVSLYVPLFAGSTPLQLALFATIFFLMKGLWFAMAQKLTMQPAVAKVLTERTEHWVPWILVGLGVWILFKNETWRWLLS